jgi:hypothetical protein
MKKAGFICFRPFLAFACSEIAGAARRGLRAGVKRGKMELRLLLYGSFPTRAMTGCRASVRRLFFCAGRYERGDRQLSRWLSATC